MESSIDCGGGGAWRSAHKVSYHMRRWRCSWWDWFVSLLRSSSLNLPKACEPWMFQRLTRRDPLRRVQIHHSPDEIFERRVTNIWPIWKWLVRDVVFVPVFPKHPQDLAKNFFVANVLPIQSFLALSRTWWQSAVQVIAIVKAAVIRSASEVPPFAPHNTQHHAFLYNVSNGPIESSEICPFGGVPPKISKRR